MWIHRSTRALHPHLRHLRHSSAAAAAAVATAPTPFDHLSEFPSAVPLTYLEGLPKPDPKHAETIFAVPRSASGTSISLKERKAGRVPSIVFEKEDGQHGGNKRLISVRTDQIKKLVNHLGRSFFLSRLFDLEVRPAFDSEDVVEKVRVLPRGLHLHAGSDKVLNVTFIRAPSAALLKVDVPLVFRGEDVSPGLKKGAYLNVINRTVKFLCPADIIPPYIDVDLSELDAGQKLVIADLKFHPALKLLRSKDEPNLKHISTNPISSIQILKNSTPRTTQTLTEKGERVSRTSPPLSEICFTGRRAFEVLLLGFFRVSFFMKSTVSHFQ